MRSGGGNRKQKALNGRPYSNYSKRHKRRPDKNNTHSSRPSSQKNALLKQCTAFRCRNEAVASFQMVHPASINSGHKTTNQKLFVGLHTHFYSDKFHYSFRFFFFVPSSSLPVAVPGCCLHYVGNLHPSPSYTSLPPLDQNQTHVLSPVTSYHWITATG